MFLYSKYGEGGTDVRGDGRSGCCRVLALSCAPESDAADSTRQFLNSVRMIHAICFINCDSANEIMLSAYLACSMRTEFRNERVHIVDGVSDLTSTITAIMIVLLLSLLLRLPALAGRLANHEVQSPGALVSWPSGCLVLDVRSINMYTITETRTYSRRLLPLHTATSYPAFETLTTTSFSPHCSPPLSHSIQPGVQCTCVPQEIHLSRPGSQRHGRDMIGVLNPTQTITGSRPSDQARARSHDKMRSDRVVAPGDA